MDQIFSHYYGDDGPNQDIVSSSLREAGSIHYSRSDYVDAPGGSARSGHRRHHHGYRDKNTMLTACDNVYRENCIVHFAIDMMSDFVTKGMQIYHPSASKQRRYRHWWKRVEGQRVSERFVNLLYRHSNVFPKRTFGQLDQDDMKDLLKGRGDISFIRRGDPQRNRIPLHYSFLNPVSVEVIGGELALFGQAAGSPMRYGLKVPDDIMRIIKKPSTPEQKVIVSSLPQYLLDAAHAGLKVIPLDPEKVSAHYYKKDDWKLWADPLVLSIMKDITLYEKMKDADRSALQGSLSRVRLWTLGLPEYQLQPGPAAFARLREQLLAAEEGGSVDLIWDATLKLTESSSDVYKFLGSAKYEPVLQAIYAGLGIPQGITGGDSGMVKNVLSLKTLMERLEYARNTLVNFWEGEFALLQRAFGDRHPAKLRSDMMNLSDEAAANMIWVQLYDRNIVTTETMREKFGLLPEVETQRQIRETKAVENGLAPGKIGPFTEAQVNPGQLTKTAMTQGLIAPSEAGTPVKPKKKGDKSLLDRQERMADKASKASPEASSQKGQPGQGRPKGKPDQTKRKTRTPKVSSGE